MAGEQRVEREPSCMEAEHGTHEACVHVWDWLKESEARLRAVEAERDRVYSALGNEIEQRRKEIAEARRAISESRAALEAASEAQDERDEQHRLFVAAADALQDTQAEARRLRGIADAAEALLRSNPRLTDSPFQPWLDLIAALTTPSPITRPSQEELAERFRQRAKDQAAYRRGGPIPAPSPSGAPSPGEGKAQCCGCSCHVCANGHASGRHIEACSNLVFLSKSSSGLSQSDPESPSHSAEEVAAAIRTRGQG